MKYIVICGASSGLGKALAEQLSLPDNHLILLSRTINNETFTHNEVTKISCDVTSWQSILTACSTIDSVTSQIDVFINCTGVGLERPLEAITSDEIETTMATNLTGLILLTKEIYKRMIPHNQGYIMHVSSTSGKRAKENEAVYCATKWGISGFSESLRLEARKHNIRVTTLYPGGMKTKFYENNPSKNTEMFMEPADVAKSIVNLLNTHPSMCPSELVIERMG